MAALVAEFCARISPSTSFQDLAYVFSESGVGTFRWMRGWLFDRIEAEALVLTTQNPLLWNLSVGNRDH